MSIADYKEKIGNYTKYLEIKSNWVGAQISKDYIGRFRKAEKGLRNSSVSQGVDGLVKFLQDTCGVAKFSQHTCGDRKFRKAEKGLRNLFQLGAVVFKWPQLLHFSSDLHTVWSIDSWLPKLRKDI